MATTRIPHNSVIYINGPNPALALGNGKARINIPVQDSYTSVSCNKETVGGSIYGSKSSTGVTWTVYECVITNGTIQLTLTPNVTLSTYTDTAKIFMADISGLSFALS